MSLTTRSLVLGTHIFFFREGDAFTVPANGTASKTSKPGANDPNWVDLGVIEEGALTFEDTELEVYGPQPGRLRLTDVINIKDKLGVKFTTSELSPFAIEAFLRTLPLNGASTQFNPLEGKAKKGWLKVQCYDHDDVQTLVLDLWVRLKASGDLPIGGSDIVKAQFEAMVLHSTLNTGTL